MQSKAEDKEYIMKLPRFFNRSSGTAGETQAQPEKPRNDFTESVLSVRSVMRKSNSAVSHPMDTAVVAGGVVGGSVKIIQDKTTGIHDQLSTASSSISRQR